MPKKKEKKEKKVAASPFGDDAFGASDDPFATAGDAFGGAAFGDSAFGGDAFGSPDAFAAPAGDNPFGLRIFQTKKTFFFFNFHVFIIGSYHCYY